MDTLYTMNPSTDLPLIIVACTGNICRSPMAEAVLRHYVEQRGIAAQVSSCGLDAPVGRRPHKYAVQVNEARGIPIDESKRSQACVSAELKRASVIFVMENHHRHQILHRHSAVGGKTFLLGHWQGLQIPDPVNDPLPVFEQVYDYIDQGSQAWLDHLLKAGLVKTKDASDRH